MKFLSLTFFAALATLSAPVTAQGNLRSLQAQWNCQQTDADGNCTKCYTRNVLKQGKCEAVSDLCKAWDETSGNCTQCYGGYALTDGKCIVPVNDDAEQEISESVPVNQPTDWSCAKYAQNGACQTCSFRYVLKEGKCTQVSDLCKEWDNATGDCTECYGGYALSEGKCAFSAEPGVIPEPEQPEQPVNPQPQPQPIVDDLCVAYDENGNCSSCSFRSVLQDGKCVKVNDLCKAWDQVSGACTQCYDGYSLAQGVCNVSA